MSGITELLFGGTVRIVTTIVVALGVVVGAGFAVGLFGVPGVAAVQNSFGPVNNSTTTIHSDLVVNNPNPVGVSLGGTSINYTVFMNDVRMASGQKNGVEVGTGNSTLPFTTRMRNERIPAWWRSHIANGEQTQVRIDARVRSSTLGGNQVALPQKKQVETDIIGQFNSDETRPINANMAFPTDPVLYINETNAQWDQEGLSRERTPINMSFDVYNPKPWPYAVTEVGYTITMNNITVGEGSSEDVATVLPGTTERLQTQTAMKNQHLDEWWVSHLQRNQVTDLRIDFYLVVDPDTGTGVDDVGSFRIPLDPVDYERTIETDMFGTKNGSAANTTANSDGESQTPTPDQDSTKQETTTADGETTTTTGGSATPTDDGGLLGDDSGSESTTTESASSPTQTPTQTPAGETTTDDGGLLG